jgi:hypothetical protein
MNEWMDGWIGRHFSDDSKPPQMEEAGLIHELLLVPKQILEWTTICCSFPKISVNE